MRQRRGFTLIETIFATFIISVVIVAIFDLFPSSMVAIKRSEMQIEANDIAQSVLEDMRAVPFDSLTPYSPTLYYPSTSASVALRLARPPYEDLDKSGNPMPYHGVKVGGVVYKVQVMLFKGSQLNPPAPAPTATPAPGATATPSSESMLKGIQVTVSWTYHSKPYKVVYETWVCNIPR